MKISSVFILAAVALYPAVSCEPTKNANNFIFEKLEYEIHDKSLVSYHNITFRLIARNTLRANITVVLTRPLPQVWIHFVLYHKYIRYQKFLIDVWEDLCEVFNDGHPGLVTTMLLEDVQRLGTVFHFKLRCPFSGTIMVTNDRVNVSGLNLPLMPAGRYRLDLSFAIGREKPALVTIQYFVRISDYRVWF